MIKDLPLLAVIWIAASLAIGAYLGFLFVIAYKVARLFI